MGRGRGRLFRWIEQSQQRKLEYLGRSQKAIKSQSVYGLIKRGLKIEQYNEKGTMESCRLPIMLRGIT